MLISYKVIKKENLHGNMLYSVNPEGFLRRFS